MGVNDVNKISGVTKDVVKPSQHHSLADSSPFVACALCKNEVPSVAGESSAATLFEGAGAGFSPPSSPTVPPYHHCSNKLNNLMMEYWIKQLTREMTIGLLVANCRMFSKRKNLGNLRVPRRCKFDASAPRKR